MLDVLWILVAPWCRPGKWWNYDPASRGCMMSILTVSYLQTLTVFPNWQGFTVSFQTTSRIFPPRNMWTSSNSGKLRMRYGGNMWINRWYVGVRRGSNWRKCQECSVSDGVNDPVNVYRTPPKVKNGMSPLVRQPQFPLNHHYGRKSNVNWGLC